MAGDTLDTTAKRNYDNVISRLENAASSGVARLNLLGSFSASGRDYPMFTVDIGNPSSNRVSVLISAGIHGDEPAGVEAALRFIEHNVGNTTLLSHYHFTVFPCDNPYGWERGLRENPQGLDLNRQFLTKQPAPEVELISRGLEGRCFDLVYEMHEDYDSPGFYMYEFGEDPEKYLGESIIYEISSFGFPINRSSIIESRRAKNGIIRLNLRTYRKTRLPKSFYSYRECGGHVLTLETPSTFFPIDERVRMHLLGLNVSLGRARLHKDAMAEI